MGLASYSTNTSVRGEIGASLVRSRIMETTLQYVRSVMNSKFENVKKMMKHTIEVGTGKWFNNVDSYIRELDVQWEDIGNMTKEEIKRMIRNYDNAGWEDSLNSKSTLKFYREGKNRIGYDLCYRNNVNSMFLARARMNSLKLEEAIGRGNKNHNKCCKLCHQEEEDLVHFTVKCPKLEGLRNYGIINKKIRNPEKRMIELLFRQNKYQETGYMLRMMWNERRKILNLGEESKRKKVTRKNTKRRANTQPVRVKR